MKEIINAIVIDDNKKDIIDITTALSAKGITTLPVHHATAEEAHKACLVAAELKTRIIITDIKMLEDSGDVNKSDISNVAKCLENIAKNISGPYIVLAWTSKPDLFNELKESVNRYFRKKNIRRPDCFECIDKSECKDNKNRYDADSILEKVEQHLNNNKGIKAIMHWEKSVLHAATDSVDELFGFKKEISDDELSDDELFDVGKEISNTLHALAKEFAGEKLFGNEAMAANESLFYILKDKISFFAQDDDSQEKWHGAIGSEPSSDICDEQRYRLNYIMHFDGSPVRNIICPGDIWLIHEEEDFFSCFSTKEEIDEQIKKLNSIFLAKNYSMICMEISPLCDFSNDKKDLKNFAIGIIASENDLFLGRSEKKIKKKKSMLIRNKNIITIPIIYDDKQSILMISKQCIMAATNLKMEKLESISVIEKKMRMRESFLQYCIQKIANYNSRIGTVSFGIR